MKTKLLIIGHSKMVEHVGQIVKEEFPRVSITTMVAHPDEGNPHIDPFLFKDLDAILITNSLEWKLEFPEQIPVFLIRPSMMAFYSTLFRCLIESLEGSTYLPTWSVDFFTDQEIKKQLLKAGIPTEQFRIKEYNFQVDADELVEFHLEENTYAVITCHPGVYEKLVERNVKAYLITPTVDCLKTYFEKINKAASSTILKKPHKLQFHYQKDDSILKQIGMSGATIHRLFRLCESIGTNQITAADLAEGFSITLRSARRILTTLEDHQIAEVIGEEQINDRGRPRYIYRIHFGYLNNEIQPLSALG
ncbi:hypothetical protein [Alkalihalobacillus sp. TS-13]|uniref:hypothetical protein n=1 Tax=Alkalihalobacillus sp. TS-13 TaxID=2842455 RepID=UPI001C87B248|nr:hypothetical protein [Alkalihalobacillus sp. TS-13]